MCIKPTGTLLCSNTVGLAVLYILRPKVNLGAIEALSEEISFSFFAEVVGSKDSG